MTRPVKHVLFVAAWSGLLVGGCTEFVVTNGAWCVLGATFFAIGAGMMLAEDSEDSS